MIATATMLAAGSSHLPTAPLSTARRRIALAPPRQALTPDELVATINRLLVSRPDCEGLEVEASNLVPVEPDLHGCNWSPDGLRLKVAHGPTTRALRGMRQVVDWARVRYELILAEVPAEQGIGNRE